MKLHQMSPAANSRKTQKRLGRGTGSGLGKTAGKGHKGQNARSGGGVRPGFEGGQLPLIRRIPRRGFNNKQFSKEYTIINVSDLNAFEKNAVITAELLLDMGIISKIAPYGLKVLGNGKLENAIKVKAAKFTESAIQKITAVGGKAEVV